MRNSHFLSIVAICLIGIIWLLKGPSSVNPPQPTVPTNTSPATVRAVNQNFGLQPQAHWSTAVPTERVEISKKLKILDEIFQAKNDNDPRLDQEFKDLSAPAKAALQEKYDALKPESRNERGTIVFLVGKNLNSEQDFDFLQNVMKEPPCKSLTNCSAPSSESSLHDAGSTELTLEYPKMVALKSLETYLGKNPVSLSALKVIQEGAKSPNPAVRQLATALMQKYAPT